MATVLIVDDRVTSREVAREVLDHGGHHVIEATGGQQALDLARIAHPDIVLTDLLMPGMDGYQFVSALRGNPDTADIPVLFYTANYRQSEAQPLAVAVGVHRIVSKSASPLELLDAVATAIHDRPAPRRAEVTRDGLNTRHVDTVNAKLLEKVQALDASEARFAAMADASPVGIVIGGTDGAASYVNPRMSDITGAPAEALLGHGWQRFLSDGHRLAMGDVLSGAEAPADRQRSRGQITTADGRQCWLTVLTRPVIDTEHGTTGIVVVIDDVTTVVEAERRRRAEDAEREAVIRREAVARFDSLARMAGGVAHDFNNMLNVMMSFGEFVKESIADVTGDTLTAATADRITDDVESICRAGQRAAHLTRQLLTFSGREAADSLPVDVNAVVREVVGMIGGTIGRHVTLDTRLDRRTPYVLGDASQLCQVLINLAVNARDAMPEGGCLCIETRVTVGPPLGNPDAPPPAEHVHVTVTDTGHGMSPEVARHAIEPFFTTKSHGQGGPGLGLATAYGIIKQAGGDLTIDSTPGAGTTVHIQLAATDLRPARTVPVGAAPDTAGTTVLVAEDEDGVRDVVVRLLSRAGYHVLAAPNGREALAVAENPDIDVDIVLTDVVMPVMNGREFADAVRQVRPGIPVLFMSGHAASLITEQGLLEPGVTVLGKPFSKQELLAAIHTTLAERSIG